MEKKSLFVLIVFEAILMLLLVEKKFFLQRKNSYFLSGVFFVVVLVRLYTNTYWSAMLFLITSIIYCVFQAFYLKDWLFSVMLFLYRNTVILITFFSLELLENSFVLFHIENSILYVWLKLVLQSACCILMIWVYKQWIKKTNQWATQESNHYTVVMSILSLFLQLETILLIFYYYESDQWFKLTYSILLYHFLLIVTMVASFFLNVINENKQELRLFKKRAALQEKQHHLVKESIHDQRAILLGLEAMIKEKDYEEVEHMLSDLLDSFGELLKEDNYQKILSIPQPAIQSIFLDFLKKAQTKKIRLKMKIDHPPQSISMGRIDFLRCLSILLNNAIENTAGDIFLDFKGVGDGVELKIINSYLGEIRLASVFQKNYSTHTNHSGLGLYILNRIVSQNKNVFYEVSVQDSKFVVLLKIL